ncbi:hypothetical protein PLEOSDRAFT_157235 [Pleurotus ostreatus PC15]|uniref:Uncharacterized protein n=1 Tax=Pleurotus ostreatus (strain PC15) TaxID=1137138 RepID=A0A067P0W9_PLEO1|nr:hypothetical protein PLEOSDRAFT_157235 [Pleurotus ostreatus PC15]
MAGPFSDEYVCQISGGLVPPAPALQFSHSDYSSSSSGPPTPPGETIDSYASPMSIDAETPRLPSVKTYADATNLAAEFPSMASAILGQPLSLEPSGDQQDDMGPKHTMERPNWALASDPEIELGESDEQSPSSGTQSEKQRGRLRTRKNRSGRCGGRSKVQTKLDQHLSKDRRISRAKSSPYYQSSDTGSRVRLDRGTLNQIQGYLQESIPFGRTQRPMSSNAKNLVLPSREQEPKPVLFHAYSLGAGYGAPAASKMINVPHGGVQVQVQPWAKSSIASVPAGGTPPPDNNRSMDWNIARSGLYIGASQPYLDTRNSAHAHNNPGINKIAEPQQHLRHSTAGSSLSAIPPTQPMSLLGILNDPKHTPMPLPQSQQAKLNGVNAFLPTQRLGRTSLNSSSSTLSLAGQLPAFRYEAAHSQQDASLLSPGSQLVTLGDAVASLCLMEDDDDL